MSPASTALWRQPAPLGRIAARPRSPVGQLRETHLPDASPALAAQVCAPGSRVARVAENIAAALAGRRHFALVAGPATLDSRARRRERAPPRRRRGRGAAALESVGAARRRGRLEGQHRPMQGWISLAYGEKQPAPVVEYHARAREATFVTVLGAGQAAYAPIAVRQSPAGDGTHVVICSSHVQHDVVVPAVARTDHPVTDVRGAC